MAWHTIASWNFLTDKWYQNVSRREKKKNTNNTRPCRYLKVHRRLSTANIFLGRPSKLCALAWVPFEMSWGGCGGWKGGLSKMARWKKPTRFWYPWNIKFNRLNHYLRLNISPARDEKNVADGMLRYVSSPAYAYGLCLYLCNKCFLNAFTILVWNQNLSPEESKDDEKCWNGGRGDGTEPVVYEVKACPSQEYKMTLAWVDQNDDRLGVRGRRWMRNELNAEGGVKRGRRAQRIGNLDEKRRQK